MNTDNNQNKQLTELSEDDRKKVTGGYVQFVEPDDDDLIKVSKPTLPTLPNVPTADGTCPEGYVLVTTVGSSLCCQA